MSTSAVSLSIKSFLQLAAVYSDARPLLLRGRPGIGKSQSIYQVAVLRHHAFYKDEANCRAMTEAFRGEPGLERPMAEFWRAFGTEPKYANYPKDIWHYDMGKPVLERRLSQLTEGDMVGVPVVTPTGTSFVLTSWLLLATRFPCVLFLDELNRALKSVEQATFQLADSRAFYGHSLHSGTQVCVAVNIGDEFDVSPMDPAAISRYAVIELAPTVEDWLTWAASHCNEALVDFIRANERVLEHNEVFEPHCKYPDRRAWSNLDYELSQADLYEEPSNPLFLYMAASMVGFAAANSFKNFCMSRNTQLSAVEALSDWTTAKRRLPKDENKRLASMVELTDKLAQYITKHKLTTEQGKMLSEILVDTPAECKLVLFTSTMKNNHEVIPFIRDQVILAATGNAPATATAATAVTAPKKSKK